MESREHHPLAPFIPEGMKYLVIGTFPPLPLTRNQLRSGDIFFYYGTRENLFWPVLRQITGLSLDSAAEIQKYLRIKGIGMTDVIESCVRERELSSDAFLKNITWRDNAHALKSRPHLLFTSTFAKKCFMRHTRDLLSTDCTSTVLPSPSGSFNRAIVRNSNYLKRKMIDPFYSTHDYRMDSYCRWFALP